MLNLAASVFEKSGPTVFVVTFFVAILLLTSPAVALDGIDLSVTAEPVAAGECPALIQIKYPFLSCADGQIGLSGADESWDDSRRMPMMSDWTEEDAWGPSMNVN